MRFKTSFWLIGLGIVCLFGCNSNTQQKNKPDTLQRKIVEGKSVASIDTISYQVKVKNAVDSIDKVLPTLDKTNKEVFGSSSEGGEISIYKNKLDTVKLSAVYYGEGGKSTYQLYFFNGQVVFFKSNLVQYQRPLNIDKVRIKKVEKVNYTLLDWRIIHVNSGKDTISKEKLAEEEINLRDIYNQIHADIETKD